MRNSLEANRGAYRAIPQVMRRWALYSCSNGLERPARSSVSFSPAGEPLDQAAVVTWALLLLLEDRPPPLPSIGGPRKGGSGPCPGSGRVLRTQAVGAIDCGGRAEESRPKKLSVRDAMLLLPRAAASTVCWCSG